MEAEASMTGAGSIRAGSAQAGSTADPGGGATGPGARTGTTDSGTGTSGSQPPAADGTGGPGFTLTPPVRRSPLRGQFPTLAVISLGGAIGACARYGASLLWPTAQGAFPWTTLLVNAAGCAVIGVFMVVITEAISAHHLVRPFFGTGVLGGFTTFSTYAVDVQRLVAGGHAGTALAYLAATAAAALGAVWTAAALTRRVVNAANWRTTR